MSSAMLPKLVYTGRTEPRASTALRPRASSGVMGDRVRRSKRQRREQRVEVDALTGRRIRSTAAPSHQNTASDSPSSPHRQLRLPPVRSRVPVAFLMPATTVAAAAASAQAEAVMGEQDRTAGWVQTTLGLGTATGAGTAVPAATGADATSADAPQTVAAAVAQQPVVSGRRVTVVTSPLQSPVIAPIATSSSGDGGAGAPMEKLRAQPSRYYLPSDDGRGDEDMPPGWMRVYREEFEATFAALSQWKVDETWFEDMTGASAGWTVYTMRSMNANATNRTGNAQSPVRQNVSAVATARKAAAARNRPEEAGAGAGRATADAKVATTSVHIFPSVATATIMSELAGYTQPYQHTLKMHHHQRRRGLHSPGQTEPTHIGQVRLVGLSLTDTHMHSDAATTIPSRPSVGLAAAASFADVSMSHEAAAARPANHATMHQGSHLFKCLSDDGVAYRHSPRMSDRHTEGSGPELNDIVECGSPEAHNGAEWLHVADDKWLPMRGEPALVDAAGECLFERDAVAEAAAANGVPPVLLHTANSATFSRALLAQSPEQRQKPSVSSRQQGKSPGPRFKWDRRSPAPVGEEAITSSTLPPFLQTVHPVTVEFEASSPRPASRASLRSTQMINPDDVLGAEKSQAHAAEERPDSRTGGGDPRARSARVSSGTQRIQLGGGSTVRAAPPAVAGGGEPTAKQHVGSTYFETKQPEHQAAHVAHMAHTDSVAQHIALANGFSVNHNQEVHFAGDTGVTHYSMGYVLSGTGQLDLLRGAAGFGTGVEVAAVPESFARPTPVKSFRAPKIPSMAKKAPAKKNYEDVSEVDGVILFVTYTDNAPMKRVEARFEVENSKAVPVEVQLMVEGFLSGGNPMTKQKKHKPIVIPPNGSKRLGMWQAPGALNTTWKWREPDENPDVVVVEMEGVFLSRSVKPPNPTNLADEPAEIHFEAWSTNKFPVVVEVEIEGEQVIKGGSLRGKIKGRGLAPASKKVKVGVVKAVGEVDVQWSWRGVVPK